MDLREEILQQRNRLNFLYLYRQNLFTMDSLPCPSLCFFTVLSPSVSPSFLPSSFLPSFPAPSLLLHSPLFSFFLLSLTVNLFLCYTSQQVRDFGFRPPCCFPLSITPWLWQPLAFLFSLCFLISICITFLKIPCQIYHGRQRCESDRNMPLRSVQCKETR